MVELLRGVCEPIIPRLIKAITEWYKVYNKMILVKVMA